MSFFTSGFSGLLNNNKRSKKKASPPKEEDDKKKKSSDKKDEGEWEMLTDAYGRACWRHSVTGDWSPVFGGGLVSPVGTVTPSPVVGYPGGAMFAPSTVFTPPPPPPPPAKKGKKKDDDKKKGQGWWETFYDEDGARYFEHTVTKRVTYKDPYV